MKLNKIYYLLLLAVITSFISCDDDDDLYPQLGEDPRNLNEILSETADLSVLYQALVEAEMDSILRETSTYTVFAPGNAAFDQADLSGLDQEERENLLRNHILSTVTADFASTLTTGYRPTMATGPDGNFLSLYINTEGETTLNGDVALVSAASDIGSTNGVLHVVDGVITPPAILDHVEANDQFSTFVEAVELAGLTEMLAVTEVTDPENVNFPLTVFAPTNAAFENLLGELNGAFGWSTLADIPTDVLRSVLEQHVITGSNLVSEEVFGTEQTPVSGEVFSVSPAGVISDASYTDGNVTLGDIQATNGIVHGIDKVMLTEAVFQSILDETLNLKERIEDRGYSSFIAALEMAGLSDQLTSAEGLSVFVPDNAAFESFFTLITNFETLADFDTEEELELLRHVLNYHLHEGILMSSQLTDGGTISTLYGDEIVADLSGENARLRPTFPEALPSQFVNANVGASNGVIHAINRVLVPADLVEPLGIIVETDEGGVCPVGDPSLVFFDWDEKGKYWGAVEPENDASLTLDGSNYGRANFQTGGTGWQDLFWRNGGTLNGGDIVGDDLQGYSLKFDINIIEPISDGMFRIRFNDSDGVDAFYNWQPWEETGEPFTTDGWETIEIPLSVLGVPDFSLIDAEFGMAFEGADVLLNFAIDNVRFDTPGGCGGPDPVADPEMVFFDWDENPQWWGNVAPENNDEISLDGSNYGRANFQTGGTGFTDLFWRNDASTFHGADVVGSNLDDYVIKFDILTFEPISEGRFRLRFNSTTNGVDAFYDWAPWQETGEPFHTEGEWVTITIPVSEIGQPDFSEVNAEFGMAFQDADVLLNFAIDNVRFEEK